MAMLEMNYDRNVWKKTFVDRIQEHSRRWWRYDFDMNEREQQYVRVKSQPKYDKYENGCVGARVRLMVRGYCLSVRGSKGMEWNGNTIMIYVCAGQKKEIYMCYSSANAMAW